MAEKMRDLTCVAKRLAAMGQPLPVSLLGSLTLDIPCVADTSGTGAVEVRHSHQSRVDAPALGGSLPWTLQGFRTAERRCRKCIFSVTIHGPKPVPDAVGPSVSETCRQWKNDRFLSLVEEGIGPMLTPARWDVPMSLHIALADGRRYSFEENTDLAADAQERCFRGLFGSPAKVVHFGSAWRKSSPRDLASKLKKLKDSVVALHTGTFSGARQALVDSDRNALKEIHEALPYVDLLFTNPDTLSFIVGDLPRQLVPSRTLCDYLTLDRVQRLPPVTVLYYGYHGIAVIVRELERIFQIRQPQSAMLHTPIGLHSCFVGAFLCEFLAALSAGTDTDSTFFKKVLAEAARDAIKSRQETSDFWSESPKDTSIRKITDPSHKPDIEEHQVPRHAFIVGTSRHKQDICLQIEKVAQTRVPVLITGHSGTGKEVVAQAIHDQSGVAREKFVAVHCGAISEHLVESELFGHEKGAFTNATILHRGAFERADGGTLFLDEIGLMPLAAQITLLRAVEQREVTRVGGTETRPTNIRLICATDRNLEEAVREGTFLEQLYYRINVYPIHVCLLRQRKEDVRPLADHFARLCPDHWGVPAPRFSAEAIDELERYDWPGNVRELRNVVERCAVEAQGCGEVGRDMVRWAIHAAGPHQTRPATSDARQIAEPLLRAMRASHRWPAVVFVQDTTGNGHWEVPMPSDTPGTPGSPIPSGAHGFEERNEPDLTEALLAVLASYARRPEQQTSRQELHRRFQPRSVDTLVQWRVLLPTNPRGGRGARIILNPELRKELDAITPAGP